MKFRERLSLFYWFIFQDGMEITFTCDKGLIDKVHRIYLEQKDLEKSVLELQRTQIGVSTISRQETITVRDRLTAIELCLKKERQKEELRKVIPLSQVLKAPDPKDFL